MTFSAKSLFLLLNLHNIITTTIIITINKKATHPIITNVFLLKPLDVLDVLDGLDVLDSLDLGIGIVLFIILGLILRTKFWLSSDFTFNKILHIN